MHNFNLSIIPFPNGDFRATVGPVTSTNVKGLVNINLFDERNNDDALLSTTSDRKPFTMLGCGDVLLWSTMLERDISRTLSEDYAEYFSSSAYNGVKLIPESDEKICQFRVEWLDAPHQRDDHIFADGDRTDDRRRRDALDESYELCFAPSRTHGLNDVGGLTLIRATRPIGVLNALRTWMQVAWSLRRRRETPNAVEDLGISGCITDAPKLPWRGLHLDTSRHFHNESVIKAVLRGMSRLKLNRFHWHLSDDQGWRLESKSFPGLHKMGSTRGASLNGKKVQKYNGKAYSHPTYHSIETARRIIAYAERRGIVVVPEIDLPAHAAALIAGLVFDDPALADTFGARVNPNAGNNDCAKSEADGAPNCMGGTYGMMHPTQGAVSIATQILKDVCHVFSASPTVHVGGDEAEFVRDTLWSRRKGPVCDLPGCSELLASKDYSAMQAVLMDVLVGVIEDPATCKPATISNLYTATRSAPTSWKHVPETVRRNAAVWDETLLELRKGRVPQSNRVLGMLWRDDRASIADIHNQYKASGVEQPQTSARLILTPKTRLYFDYLQYFPESKNRYWPLNRPSSSAKHQAVSLSRGFMTHGMLPTAHEWQTSLVYGVEGCIWTELITQAAMIDYQLFPRIYALADAAWTLRDVTDDDMLTKASEVLPAKIRVLDEYGASHQQCRWICNYQLEFTDVGKKQNHAASLNVV